MLYVNSKQIVWVLGFLVGAQLASAGEVRSHLGSDRLTPVQRLGKQIYHDVSLSEPAGEACASCHDPAHGFSAPNAAAVSEGARPGHFGARNAPSIAYALYVPPPSRNAEGKLIGGLFWDGRAADLVTQAKGPFLNPDEMANTSAAMVVAKLKHARYAGLFRNVFGGNALDDDEQAFHSIAMAIAAYETASEFHPFSSKFDYYMTGKVNLTPQEKYGLQLFKDKDTANCAACHPASSSQTGIPPLFTDFSYDSLGLPRNRGIAKNANPAFHDLGLCGPVRHDLLDQKLCGAFRVPTLRNVALTAPYMHNGVFRTLKEVVEFYNTRDTNPRRWYPRGKKFDDLPAQYHDNANHDEVPYDRKPDERPHLTAREVNAIVAFLETLTDGYQLPRQAGRINRP
jgi:cytochrome c peroxidase